MRRPFTAEMATEVIVGELKTRGHDATAMAGDIRCLIEDVAHSARRDEREACASFLEKLRMDEVLLAVGEMSAQERRTVKALLPWLAYRMRDTSRRGA